MRLDWASFLDLLRQSNRFILTSHVRPDCDALGSELGLLGVLETVGKSVRIVNAQATPATLAWMDPHRRIESLESLGAADLGDFDCLIVLDTSAFAQLGAMAAIVRNARDRVLVIDHHVSEDDLSDRWFKDTASEATGRIVAEIAMRLGVSLTPEISTPLFAAIATDTGWFRFPSVTGETYRIASRLSDAGAEPASIYRELYEQESIARLHLVGRTLAGATLSHDGAIITSIVRRTDMEQTGARGTDTEDLVNLTLAVRGTQVAVILIEQPDGTVKVSFRSRGHVDCALLAATFGGGGHKAAAGAIFDGPFDTAADRVRTSVDAAWRASFES